MTLEGHNLETYALSTESRGDVVFRRNPAVIICKGGAASMGMSTSGHSKNCYLYGFGEPLKPTIQDTGIFTFDAHGSTLEPLPVSDMFQTFATGLLGFSMATRSDPAMFSCLGVSHSPVERVSPVENAVYAFARKVAGLDFVKAVSWSREDESVHVWTYINQRDREMRRMVYASEFEVMAEFPDVNFDFNVLSLDVLGVGEFQPSAGRGQLVLYRS
jgi:hypothetical protein